MKEPAIWENKFKGLFRKMKPVGSRVTCDPAPMDTDEDYLCYDFRKCDDEIRAEGFILEGNPSFYTGNDNGNFRSWRRGNINLIVTPDLEFFDLFMTATHLAKHFNLLEKQDRIALFQAILYGVKTKNLNV